MDEEYIFESMVVLGVALFVIALIVLVLTAAGMPDSALILGGAAVLSCVYSFRKRIVDLCLYFLRNY